LRVLERYAPAHVVVDREGDVLHYSARTGKYLEAAVGQPSRQLVALARSGLRLELRAALREAMETRRRTERERIAVEAGSQVQAVRLVVEPLGGGDGDPVFLVLFEDVGAPFAPPESRLELSEGGDQTALQLEGELRDTQERLQTTIEEYESVLEELKSSNEELQSANEELQSTNEEMETSKEEMQSVNEEFQTVNSELSAKIEELDRANSDLRNLFESTQLGTVFLDTHLFIRSFTPAATAIFKLIPSDRGRPLTDIVSSLDTGDLKGEIQRVLKTGETIERRIARSDGTAQYFTRIIPYMSERSAIEGVLVTFFDVTKLAEGEARLRTLVDELNHRVRNMLTVVNAIAAQTLTPSRADPALVQEFTGRIRAMSMSYSLVSRENWGEVALSEIVSEQLRPYRKANGGHIDVAGPLVMCKPNAAMLLGLVVHELGTNAVKHGSLSKSGGSLSVNWEVGGVGNRALVINWRERGGPPSPAPPAQGTGFGWKLIDREIKSLAGASIRADYSPQGLEATFTIPLGPTSVVSVQTAE
jgi:two-component system CheB/CheR fusion protein